MLISSASKRRTHWYAVALAACVPRSRLLHVRIGNHSPAYSRISSSSSASQYYVGQRLWPRQCAIMERQHSFGRHVSSNECHMDCTGLNPRHDRRHANRMANRTEIPGRFEEASECADDWNGSIRIARSVNRFHLFKRTFTIRGPAQSDRGRSQ